MLNAFSFPRRAFVKSWMIGLHLAIPVTGAADGASHAGVVLGAEDYSSNYFDSGREDDRIAWSSGLTVKSIWSDERDTFPTLGAALSRWEHEVNGDCCGFENERIDVSVTALDLLWGNLSTKSNGVHEALYVLAGVSSVDNEVDFDNPEATGVAQGRERGKQLGFGFFAGTKGGFSGGFEVRRTWVDDHYSVRTQVSLGYGF